jgi:serine/threonine protein kinase
MTAPSTGEAFLELVRKSGLADPERLAAYEGKLRAKGRLPAPPEKLAAYLLRKGFLTRLQCDLLLRGQHRGFTLGRYLLLEQLGSRSLGTVRGLLCLDLHRRERVAVTLLRTLKADASGSQERVYQEAKAATALEHPNVARVYGYKRERKQPFLVREYVDGHSLRDLVGKRGPLPPARAADYVRQAAAGLQHAHDAGLIHRAIHPGILLLDRQGTVKVLNLGLAGFFRPRQGKRAKRDDAKGIPVPAEYLAPEVAAGGDAVDGRADVYGLGATLHFLLTGLSPVEAGPDAEEPADVPEELAAVIARMTAADPARRYPTPAAVVEALAPFAQGPVPPPAEEEMPHLCAAVLRPRFPTSPQAPSPPAPPEVPAEREADAETAPPVAEADPEQDAPARKRPASAKRKRAANKPRPAPARDAETPPEEEAPAADKSRPDPVQRGRTAASPRPSSPARVPERPDSGAGAWTSRTATAPRPTPQESRQTRTAVKVGVALAVVAVCLAAVVIIASNRTKTEPTIGVDGQEMMREFRTNELDANLKYMGKSVVIKGVFVKVTDGAAVLDVGKPAEGLLYCRPDKDDEAKVAELQKGEQLTVTGTCRGAKHLVRGVELTNCQFSK